MLSEISRPERTNPVGFHLHEGPGLSRRIHRQSDGGEGEGSRRRSGTECQFGKMRKLWRRMLVTM